MELDWSKATTDQLFTIMRYEDCSDHYKTRAQKEITRRIAEFV
ncbi:hypothetical protein [Peribacillus muralis]